MLTWSGSVTAKSNADGFLRGRVTAENVGAKGAIVEARSFATGRVYRAISSERGQYRIHPLQPGRYEVIATLSGYRKETRSVMVVLGQGTAADFHLITGDIDELIVTGSRDGSVDVVSAETTTVFSSQAIEKLPVARDVNAVALLAPGAVLGDTSFGTSRAQERAHYSTGYGYAAFGGSSVAENVYYINGMNVTNFRNGLGGATVPFEFYEQFQLQTGGFSAKFGRSTGGVLNAITKRGSNEWIFRAGHFFEPERLRSTSPDVLDPTESSRYYAVYELDKHSRSESFVSAGGALIKNRLFFYGIYQGQQIEEDNYRGSEVVHREISNDPFWGGKLDWLVGDWHSFELTAFSDQKATNRAIFPWDEFTHEMGGKIGDTTFNRGGRNYILSYSGRFTNRLSLAILTGRGKYDLTTSSSSDDTCPYAFDSRGGGLARIGCWSTALPSSGYDTRQVIRLEIEYNLGDRHLLHIGGDNETNASVHNRRYSGPRGDYFRYYDAVPGSVLNNGGVVPAGITTVVRYRLYRAGGRFETISGSFFIEDEWQISERLFARIGLRNERFNNKNSRKESFIQVTRQWAPRLAVVWDISNETSSKLFANFGRYHLPIPSNTNIRLAGGELFTQEWYTLGGEIMADGSVVLGDKIGPTTVFGDGSIPPTEETIDTTIKPMYQDEIIAGYERSIGDGYLISASYVYRNLGRVIEDITIDEAIQRPGTFHYILTNPGTDVITRYDVDGDGFSELLMLSADQIGMPKPLRKYLGLNLVFETPEEAKFYLRAGYTWSHSYGNYEGLVRSDNGQDDAGITTMFDLRGLTEGSFGNLPNDRRHSLKILARMKMGERSTISMSGWLRDGRPRSAFGIHPTDPYAALYGASSFYAGGMLVNRGSLSSTDMVTNVDIGFRHVQKSHGNHDFIIRIDIFNLLNSSTVTEVVEVADDSTGMAYPYFELPSAFQAPRSIRFGFTYDFSI